MKRFDSVSCPISELPQRYYNQKESTMNEIEQNTGTEAVLATATPLTDEQVAALLATRPEGTFVAEADEVSADEPTVH